MLWGKKKEEPKRSYYSNFLQLSLIKRCVVFNRESAERCQFKNECRVLWIVRTQVLRWTSDASMQRNEHCTRGHFSSSSTEWLVLRGDTLQQDSIKLCLLIMLLVLSIKRNCVTY